MMNLKEKYYIFFSGMMILAVTDNYTIMNE